MVVILLLAEELSNARLKQGYGNSVAAEVSTKSIKFLGIEEAREEDKNPNFNRFKQNNPDEKTIEKSKVLQN